MKRTDQWTDMRYPRHDSPTSEEVGIGVPDDCIQPRQQLVGDHAERLDAESERLAALEAALAEPAVEPVDIDKIASERYKVVPSHDSMFHRWAVVAGDGTQQLYIGREVECQNMARKFAGAFLDGAFAAAAIAKAEGGAA